MKESLVLLHSSNKECMECVSRDAEPFLRANSSLNIRPASILDVSRLRIADGDPNKFAPFVRSLIR